MHYGPQRDPKQEFDTAEKPELLALGANGMILLLVPQTHPFSHPFEVSKSRDQLSCAS
jgi:hypothetical protein